MVLFYSAVSFFEHILKIILTRTISIYSSICFVFTKKTATKWINSYLFDYLSFAGDKSLSSVNMQTFVTNKLFLI